jgi:hypothetical protein
VEICGRPKGLLCAVVIVLAFWGMIVAGIWPVLAEGIDGKMLIRVLGGKSGPPPVAVGGRLTTTAGCVLPAEAVLEAGGANSIRKTAGGPLRVRGRLCEVRTQNRTAVMTTGLIWVEQTIACLRFEASVYDEEKGREVNRWLNARCMR